ncbi:MAG: mandelate racemase/muconate lactonizing enzyme family protein [Rhodobacteraceae bacterium]|nr:mandelate racemase/muconate lactonizing enzyme family protein [Paracoccaceae bacterium]
MRITDIRNATAPMASNISNAYIDFSKMTASVVAVVTDVVRDGKPVIGYGFNSNGRYAAKGLLAERFIPRLLGAAPEAYCNVSGDTLDPLKIWDLLFANEKPGGHGERSVAIGVLDMAVWDATAKIAGVPLYRLLADRFRGGEIDRKVWVYAAGGYYYPGKGLDALQDEMRSYLDRGYRVVKMKIGGAPLEEDLRRIDAALSVVDGDGSRLCVDANGRFDLKTALAYARAMENYQLRWYEEAGDPLDFELQRVLAEAYAPPLATGENLFSHQDARNLARYGGMRTGHDVFQFDCALSYGLVEYLRTLETLTAHGFSARDVVPHGGHQMSLNIAAGLGLGGNESYPDVFAPFGGFADDVAVEDGYVGLPDAPGVGFESKTALIKVMREATAL